MAPSTDEIDMREYVRQSNLIEDIDDPIADQVSWVAWQWLARQLSVDVDTVRTLHVIVTATQLDITDDDRGRWRSHAVYVGDYVPAADYVTIAEQMTSWVFMLQCAIREPRPGDTPKKFHIEFEKIHPFADGNGRVGRMLMWWHERRIGVEPTLLRATSRHEYYRWFQ